MWAKRHWCFILFIFMLVTVDYVSKIADNKQEAQLSSSALAVQKGKQQARCKGRRINIFV